MHYLGMLFCVAMCVENYLSVFTFWLLGLVGVVMLFIGTRLPCEGLVRYSYCLRGQGYHL